MERVTATGRFGISWRHEYVQLNVAEETGVHTPYRVSISIP